jgi:hypothetical protein
MENTVLDKSAYLKSIIAPRSSSSTSLIPLTGNITFEGKNGFRVYRDDNDEKKLILEQDDVGTYAHPPITNYWAPFTVTAEDDEIISGVSVTPDNNCGPSCSQGHIESISVSKSTLDPTKLKFNYNDRVIITNSTDGGMTTSLITVTELEYLDDVTSSIQTQLNAKASNSISISSGTGLTGGGDLSSDRTISIANGGVNTTQLANSAVTTNKINNSAVTTNKINDSAVTTNKINDSAVTTSKIADDAVTSEKLATNITIEGNLIVKGTIQAGNDITAFDNVNVANYINTPSPISYEWNILQGFTSNYESDDINIAQYRFDTTGNVYLRGIVKRKTGKIISGEKWINFQHLIYPQNQINSRFNISSIELKEFIYSTLIYDGTEFYSTIEILNKNINEEADHTTSFYLDGIIYNKIM